MPAAPTNHNDETICALATGQGGAIGVIRVDGPEAITITQKIFSRDLSQARGYTILYGHIDDSGGERLDDVLVSIFSSPHSYTGSDMTEISCHASPYIINGILRLLTLHGCRQALPGEFTQRAFLAGKMDLSQAEAVADLIAAESQAAHKVAMSQMKGNFSSELSSLRDQLLRLTSLLELELDFSDQDVEFADRSQLLLLARNISSKLSFLAQSFQTGQALKKGVPVAIVGKTNVGKSTLLNRLAGDDIAIVSHVEGTTRDSIEARRDIHGVSFRFIDTAGLRETSDEIELMGIERTKERIAQAAIVLWLTDEEPTDDEQAYINQIAADKPVIKVRNKADLQKTATNSSLSKGDHGGSPLQISAKYGQGIDTLIETIYKAADIPTITQNDVIVTSARHYDALMKAQQDIEGVIQGIESTTADLLAADLRHCLAHLADILGEAITPEETLQNIFSHFCVGK